VNIILSEVIIVLILLVPLELLLEEFLLKYLFLLVLLLDLAHLARVHEPVHLLEPLLVLLVHQFHQNLVLFSEFRVVGRELDGSEDAYLGGLKLAVLTLGHGESEEGLRVGRVVVDRFFAEFDCVAELVSLEVAKGDV